MAKDVALRIEQVSEQTGWRESTVRAKILRREIEFVKLGRSVRIMQSVVDKLISEGTVVAMKPAATPGPRRPEAA